MLGLGVIVTLLWAPSSPDACTGFPSVCSRPELATRFVIGMVASVALAFGTSAALAGRDRQSDE